MNLLDKKLEEKLHFFEEEYENNIIKNDIKIQNNKISNKNSDFIGNIKNSTKNYFDKIYSDFFLFPNYNRYILNGDLYNFKDKSKYDENIKNSPKLIKKGKNNTKNNKSKIILNQNKIYQKINILNNDIKEVGDRLYNNSFLVKTKLEHIRNMRDEAIRKQMNPKISEKSKKIKGDKSRLYNENVIQKMRKNISQKNIIEKDKTCTFRPTLNKKSLKIAEKLEPSTFRLNKKKLKINKNEIIDLTQKNYSNLFGNNMYQNYMKNNDNSKINLNKSDGNISKRINEFYQKQLDSIKNKEKIYNENKLKKEEEYKKYPFHPIINNKKSNMSLNHINKDINTFERLYKTNKTCGKKNHINGKINIKDICTFKPNISPLNLKDDKKMIKFNATQSNLYIQKRRKNIRNQKNLEEYKNKKLGNIFGLFRPAIAVKKNGIRTERRYSSKGNISYNKEENNKYLITKGTIDFNSDYNSNSKEKIYYYLNDESNDMNINIIKYNNIKKDLNKKEFLDAVNALHNQLDKLNI